jgi:hypothetical protein
MPVYFYVATTVARMQVAVKHVAAALAVAAIFAVAFPAPIMAATPTPPPPLRALFWTDLDGIQQTGEEYPLSDAEASRRVLEEAAWVFSGMIDGFDFEWAPANTGRKVEERFSLVPIGTVAKGDPRLVPGEARRDSSRLSAWIDFRPDEADLRALETIRGAAWKSAQGRGAVDVLRGWPGRREAYVQAVKAGLEAWARAVEPNRPRLLRGRVAFSAVPSLVIVDGAYTVQARIRLEPLELLRWAIW